MIKFNCLIHKETGTVIKYEDWLDLYSYDNGMFLGKSSYHNEEMIFSDDFEIIYNSEFTTKELTSIDSKETMNKIGKILNKRYQLEMKYGIEV